MRRTLFTICILTLPISIAACSLFQPVVDPVTGAVGPAPATEVINAVGAGTTAAVESLSGGDFTLGGIIAATIAGVSAGAGYWLRKRRAG
jgi:hypothetical protein